MNALAALPLLFVATSAYAHGGVLKLQAGFANPTLMAGKSQTTYLKIAVEGAPLEAASARGPINLSVVIDRSGSMGGDKIERAKEAAMMLVDRLGPNDILSVVAYDDSVTTLVPATKVTDPAAIKHTISQLFVGGSTALFAGVSKGIFETRKFLDVKRTNRVILLSDGQANVGPSSPNDLGRLGMSAAKEGISITTIGIGLGYNEDLMSQLAMRSDGNHAFAANAEDLQRLFDSELGDVMSVCAKTVVVQIDFGPGVKPLRALNREVEINGRTATFSLNQVYSKQEKYVLFEVAMDAGAAGSERDAVVATARYKNRDGSAAEPVKANGRIAFTAAPADVDAREDKVVQVAVAESIATENARVAIQLRDEGKVNEAKQRLQQNSAYIDQQAVRLGSSKLKKIGDSNRMNEANIDNEKNWNATRKQMRKDEHEIQTQQSY